MNKNWLYYLGGALLVGILVLMFYKIDHTANNYYQDRKAIDSLNTVIKEVKKQELQIDSTIKVYKETVNKLNVAVAKDKKDLEDIKKQQHEKINTVRKYNATQLDSFFANRYHTSLPTNNGSKTDSH